MTFLYLSASLKGEYLVQLDLEALLVFWLAS